MNSVLEQDKIKYYLKDVNFDYYSPDEIKRISMKQLTSPVVYNNFQTATSNSLADPCMGVGAFDRNSTCLVCNQNNENCTGHFAHIQLSTPIYNPFLLNQILKLLNAKCFNCHKLKMDLKDTSYLLMKLFLIKMGLYNEAESLHKIMYEILLEDTSSINKKILKFLKENILINKDYFDDYISTIEDSEKLKEKAMEMEEVEEEDKKKDKKKKTNSKKEKDEELKKVQEKTNKKLIEQKEKELEEIFKKIEKCKKEYIKGGKIIIYEADLTGNTILKEFEKEFWLLTKVNKCCNCGASSAKFKKFTNSRFFRIMPSEKDKKKMEKIGINPEKGALTNLNSEKNKEKIKKTKKKKKHHKKNSDDEMSIESEDSDEDEESENEENEEDESEDSKNQELKDEKKSRQIYLHSMEVRSNIEKLFKNDSGLISLFYGNLIYDENTKFKILITTTGIDMFFIQYLIVPPNRFRPENSSISGDQGIFLHHQTNLYRSIISIDNDIKELTTKLNEKKEVKIKTKNKTDKNENGDDLLSNINDKRSTTYFDELIKKCIELQETVNTLFDSSKGLSKKDQESKGIRQILEKKEGIIRMKMMGKRVNYSGRTVISPDPLIGADEVGIPLYIASKLFYPEKVTKFNIDEMKKLIINGPFKYPGASQVITKDGRTISLTSMQDKFRKNLAEKLQIGQIVQRHMQNGDILLVNRQPTLHKPSIMSHKAIILSTEKTFRLHYSNCASYNADFDGDEMNIHFLQDEVAREEGYTISNTSNQYIVPTSGRPIRGLLQDSIDSNVYLTQKNTFFTRDEYFELVYCTLEKSLNTHKIKKIVLVEPAILKPKILYTGKQVISTILLSLCTSPELYNKQCENLRLNFVHNNKLGGSIWGKGNEEEGNVRVRNNELLTGVLDKNEIGASDFGLIHSFYEIYGSNLTGELITLIGKVGVFFFQRFHAFTCSVADIVLDEKTNLKRRVDIEKILMKGMSALGKLLEVKDFDLKFDNYSKRSVYNTQTKEEEETINSMNLSKEEKKEVSTIIKLQNMKLDDTLFKFYSQKHLSKSIEPYNNSYNKIKELRDKYESVILKDSSLDINVDTVVKNALNEETSKVPKNWLEKGLVFPFPCNRFAMMVKSGSKGSVVNHTLVTCMLGQQELEGRRAPRLPNGKTLPSFEAFDPNPRSSGYITDRFSTGVRPQEFFFHAMAGREGLIDTAVKTSRSGYLQRCLMKHLEQLTVNYDYTVRDYDGNIVQFYYGEDSVDTINTRFLDNFKFITDNFDSYLKKYKPERIEGKIDTKATKDARTNKEITKDDTMLNKFEPWKYLGSISEKIYNKMQEYLTKDPDKKFDQNSKDKISRSKFKNIIYLKYLTSLVQPGESVGVLAAQSIGEPSTQMTLNTFHLAGHGGANVTLGIPRLREILMTSEKKIKTPIMTIPILIHDEEKVKKLVRNFENYKLIDILKEINLKQGIKFDFSNSNNEKQRNYKVQIVLESEKNIKEYFCYNKKSLLKILKLQFIPLLAKLISRYIKMGMNKGEISAKNIIEDENDNAKAEEETNTDKYNSNQNKTKDNYEDTIEDENENENKEEDDSEQEKTYDDKFTNEEETNTFQNNEDYMTNENEEISESVESDNKNKKNTKDKKNDAGKEKSFIYNDIKITDMELNNNKEKEVSEFTFELSIPYVQKNILLKNILDIALKKLNFKSVKNIKNCYLLDKENKKGGKDYTLQLEGFNFSEVSKYSDVFDINHIGTNDIGGILNIYGIEACRAAIVKEIMSVFDVYSIKVDKRHLGLIADYITFQGKYRSFSRIGMAFSSSPLLKMSYETTMEFLTHACTSKGYDKGDTPSSRIILGRPPKLGTGVFDLFDNKK